MLAGLSRLPSKSTTQTKTSPRIAIADMHDSAAAIGQKVERENGGFNGVFCINIGTRARHTGTGTHAIGNYVAACRILCVLYVDGTPGRGGCVDVDVWAAEGGVGG